MSNIPKDNHISLSSWNYGSYSWTNPYYNVTTNSKPQPIKIYQGQYCYNDNIVNLKNEKIVKNIYFENKDYMNYINRDNEPKNKNKRVNSAKQNMNNINKINNNNSNNNNNTEFHITFDDWKKNKNKKIREEKKKKLEEEEKNKIQQPQI